MKDATKNGKDRPQCQVDIAIRLISLSIIGMIINWCLLEALALSLHLCDTCRCFRGSSKLYPSTWREVCYEYEPRFLNREAGFCGFDQIENSDPPVIKWALIPQAN